MKCFDITVFHSTFSFSWGVRLTPFFLPYKKTDRVKTRSDQDSTAVFTGTRVAWVYPDFKTGIVGQFVTGTMLSAREAEVMENGIPKIKPSLLDLNRKIYAFDPSTDMHRHHHLF
jgi:hypothetical protein